MRVDADDFARPCSCGREHQIAVKEILIEAGAVEKLEEEMSEGMLREYISPLVICDTNTYAATEELMEDIYDRCQVLVLDAEGLQADRHAIKIVENNMEEDIDLILAVGAGTIHDISRYIAHNYKVPFISVPTAASGDGFCNNSSSNDPGWSKEDCAFSSPDLCICRYRYFFKSTTAPDCSRDFRPDGEIHLSCRLEDREPGHRRVFLPRNCKAGRESVKNCEIFDSGYYRGRGK